VADNDDCDLNELEADLEELKKDEDDGSLEDGEGNAISYAIGE
jgi:hypothetical protein